MEIQTGISLVLITKPNAEDKFEALRQVYSNLYVPLVSANVFSTAGQRVQSRLFEQRVADFFKI
jgi:hypothetical protein